MSDFLSKDEIIPAKEIFYIRNYYGKISYEKSFVKRINEVGFEVVWSKSGNKSQFTWDQLKAFRREGVQDERCEIIMD